jgi:magnesium-transporting ATPase (P-type)
MPRYGQRPSPMESMYSLVFGVLMAVVTYFGVRWAYRTNAKCDGKNFIERYTILNVPILVRFCVIAMPCSIIFITTIMAFSEEHSWLRIHAFLLFRIVALFVFYLYYYLLSKSFGRLGKLLKKGD